MTTKQDKAIYNRLHDIITSNDVDDAIYMIRKEFSINIVPYFEKRIF